MVSRFWSHGRQLAVVARTGPTLIHEGAEAKIQVLYVCEFHRSFPYKYERIFIPYRLTQKIKKMCLVP